MLARIRCYALQLSSGPAPSETHRFPYAGQPNPRVRLGVVAASGGEVTWLEVSEDPVRGGQRRRRRCCRRRCYRRRYFRRRRCCHRRRYRRRFRRHRCVPCRC